MIGFNLPTNYVEDPKALIRRTKAKTQESLSFRVGRPSDKTKLNTRI
jgi:hypothetical protein